MIRANLLVTDHFKTDKKLHRFNKFTVILMLHFGATFVYLQRGQKT